MAGKTASKGQLRPATPMDSVNIVRLLKQQYAESTARLLGPFNEEKVLAYVTNTLANRFAFSIVVEASGRLLGTAAIAPIPLAWCGVVVMGEAWFAVVPACREREVPAQLLAAIGRVADQQKIPVLHGTNLLAPPSFDELLDNRKELVYGRTTFVRLPVEAKKEVA